MNINRLKAEGRKIRSVFRRTEVFPDTSASHAAMIPPAQSTLCSVIHLLLQVLWFRGHLQDPLRLAGGEAARLLPQQGERPGNRHIPHCAGENGSGVCSLPGGKQVRPSYPISFILKWFILFFSFTSSPSVCSGPTQPPLALSPQAFGHSRQSSAGPVHHGFSCLFWQRQQADSGSLVGSQQAGCEEVCRLRRDAGAGRVRRRVLRLQPLADERQRGWRSAHTQ